MKEKMKKLICLILVLIGALSMVACGSDTQSSDDGSGDAPSATPDKVYTIKLTSNDAATTLWHKEHLAAIERIKERTNGGVDIQFHGSGEMLVGDEGNEAVVSDAAVLYFADPGNLSDYCPELMAFGAPYLWNDYTEIEKFQGTDTFEKLMDKAKEANLHMVCLNVVGSRHILASESVTTVEDCKKLTLRVPGTAVYTQTFEALGAKYQALPFSEVYNALETGMVNGTEITSGNLIALRPDESMKGDKYYSLTNHMLCAAALWCGEGFWNSLPEEYQQIISEEFTAAAKAANTKVNEAYFQDLETIKGYGITVVEVPDKSSFVEAVADMNAAMPGFAEISAAVEALRG